MPDVTVNDAGRHVVINLPQTRLFLFDKGQLVRTFPVAVGKMLTRTPTGSFEVTGIYRDPAWHVPRSIQEEMRARGKPVQTVVPPGADNPLGRMFIRFGEPGLGLGIHGTNAPGSVPGFRSHGCVRMKNEDVLALGGIVSPGTEVTVTYQTVLLNTDGNGDLWLTVYHNLYQHDDVSMRLLADTLLAWQKDNGRTLYGKRVDDALRERSGRPVCLSCAQPRPAKTDANWAALRWLSTPSREEGPATVTAPIPGERGSARQSLAPQRLSRS
ncbi:hypothetical protein GCM10011289_12150 [Paludibacterium paludis]|uniref:L,D-TPase catalytic domain-containing protein n=2 Tax=Paludibacterium paludis TaxID=1225769 RepID=A0A918U8P0_9NEIS|nr:hypothetical protein GCM10011289_12150 [Paludibacterium paludis]